MGQPVARSSTSERQVGGGGAKTCPQCEKDLTREGMRKHMMVANSRERSAAGNSVREVFGGRTINVGPRKCPDCSKRVRHPPGSRCSRASNHGYVSPTKQQRDAAKAS